MVMKIIKTMTETLINILSIIRYLPQIRYKYYYLYQFLNIIDYSSLFSLSTSSFMTNDKKV